MKSDFVPLIREQCLRQMGTAPVGRIIYTRHAMPAVELVNFAMDAGDRPYFVRITPGTLNGRWLPAS